MSVQDQVLAIEAKIQANREKLGLPKADEPPSDPPLDNAPVEADADPTPEADPPADAAPVEADTDSDEDEHDEDSAASDGDEPTAPRTQSRREQRRFNKLTREKYDALRERDALAVERAYLLQQIQQNAPRAADPPVHQGQATAPTLEQFGYDQDAYQDARDNWVVQQAEQRFEQKYQQREAQAQMEAQGNEFRKGIEALEKETPGAWNEAISAPIVTTPAMEQAIFQSGALGPRIGLYLARHPDEAQAIAHMHPLNQAVAIGEIRASFKAAPPVSAPPPRPVTVTRAPAPPAPLPSGSSSVAKDWSKATLADHIAEVEAQRRAKYAK